MNRSLEHARALLEKAEGDFRIYMELLNKQEIPEWGVGFHAEQAVEKTLKAVLSSRGIKYPHTHDLQTLVNLVEHEDLPLPPRSEDLPRLTPFGTVMRYESILDDPMLEGIDWTDTENMVEGVLNWARQRIREGRQDG